MNYQPSKCHIEPAIHTQKQLMFLTFPSKYLAMIAGFQSAYKILVAEVFKSICLTEEQFLPRYRILVFMPMQNDLLKIYS